MNIKLRLIWIGFFLYLVLLTVSAEKDVWERLLYLTISFASGLKVICINNIKRGAESMLLWIVLLIFSLSYLLMYGLFYHLSLTNNSHLTSTLLSTLFSGPALASYDHDITYALEYVAAGFVGLMLSSIIVHGWKQNITEYRTKSYYDKDASSTLIKMGSIIYLLSSSVRWYLGAGNPASVIELPFGLMGLINISSSYVGPYIISCGLMFSMAESDKRKSTIILSYSLAIGIFNFLLFYSKASIFIPMVFLLFVEWMSGIRIISFGKAISGVLIVVFLYPFLNIYRSLSWAESLDKRQIEVVLNREFYLNGITEYHEVLLMGISSLLARLLGLDPLLTLITLAGKPLSPIESLLTPSFDLDEYLTFKVLGFNFAMGVSPGFLGRLYYMLGDPIYASVGTVFIIVGMAKILRILNREDYVYKCISVLFLIQCISITISGPKIKTLIIGFFSLITVGSLLKLTLLLKVK